MTASVWNEGLVCVWVNPLDTSHGEGEGERNAESKTNNRGMKRGGEGNGTDGGWGMDGASSAPIFNCS